MKNNIVNGLLNLIKIKSLVTLMLTVVFCILALKSVVDGNTFTSIFMTVIGFYFGTQTQKASDNTTSE